MKINDKIAIVTGGASGLGLEIATGLLKNGAQVIILDIDTQKINKLDPKFIAYNIDITHYDLVQKCINDIIEKFSTIDILINNAGVIHSEPLINIMHPSSMKHSYENFKKNLEINLHSVFILSSIVAEQMVFKRTSGVIINISSISAKGNAGQTAYSASKAAVEAMTKTWAKELGTLGIRSNAIAPGFINTASTHEALNEKTIKHIMANTPLRKLGTPNNIFHTVQYIIENDFLNGSVIEVNGGLVI